MSADERPPDEAAPRRNVRARSYRELYEALPSHIQQLADATFGLFEANPDHPSLRRHLLHESGRGGLRPGSISVSLNMKYRAGYAEDDETNVWYWIGTHARYNRLLG